MPKSLQRRSCPAYSVCAQLRKLLPTLGVPREEIKPGCVNSTDWPCEYLIDNARLLYDTASPEYSSEILQFVSSLFTSSDQLISPGFDRNPSEAPFQCRELEIDIHQPCLVDSCAFHTDNAWTLNCILYYQVLQGRDSLNLNELAFLLGRGISDLRSRLNRIFKSLQHGALKETVQRDGAGELLSRIDPDHVCVVCERKIDRQRRGLVRAGVHYCSSACADQKPPQVIQLEREFRSPIANILSHCVKKFADVKHMSDSLSISSNTFIDWCRRSGVEIPKEKL